MASTTHRSTIDTAEPALEVERAAVIFAHGERGPFPPKAIASLRMAIELTMIVVPQCGRHHAERAVALKLVDANDVDDVIRRVREYLSDVFPTKN
jgi:hypothetical protein